MKKLRFSLLAMTAVALAACSTQAPPPPPQMARPVFNAPATNYTWTQGNAAKGFEAMASAFGGRMTLRPGEFLWAPTIPATGETRITVDLANQIAFVFRDDQLIGVTNISSGKKGHPTPLGFWSIQFKRPMYRSKKYDNAPMPFMQSIDDHGIALHAGVTPGYPASHGCIRLPKPFAQRLFGLTKVGDKVTVEG